MSIPAKKPIKQCSCNGCKEVIKPTHFICEKCWELVPASLRTTYLRERQADPLGDSVRIAAQACIEAAEQELADSSFE